MFVKPYTDASSTQVFLVQTNPHLILEYDQSIIKLVGNLAPVT